MLYLLCCYAAVVAAVVDLAPSFLVPKGALVPPKRTTNHLLQKEWLHRPSAVVPCS